jgi:solute:Na+ symporter, SSS family
MTSEQAPLLIIAAYLGLLLILGTAANRLFRGTSRDYMLASHSIGPVLLLMSLFGTTMTSFALIGSTGASWREGIAIYGKMASWSGLIHSLCFFLVGVRLWRLGHRYHFSTQVQFFRARLESDGIGLLLFPVLVLLVIPYLLMGLIGAGAAIQEVSVGAFPEMFPGSGGGIPFWLGSLVVAMVVLAYVFFGGMRGTAWANAFQTTIFMVLGMVSFVVIVNRLGGTSSLLENMQIASQSVLTEHPEKLSRVDVSRLSFFLYMLIPLSVAMFPHVFQHWLTARSADTFKLSVVMHPIFILIVWAPCVMVGVWANSSLAGLPADIHQNQILPYLVRQMAGPILGGFLTAGVLAAIMSSLDSQFLCLGTMFTNDMVLHYSRKDRFSDLQVVVIARSFIVAIVALSYLLSLWEPPGVFTLGVWCFSGFTGLFPLVFAALYWQRLTVAGAAASIVTMVVTWVLLFWQSGFGSNPGYTFMGLMPVAVILAAATVALLGVSLATRPPSEETLLRFFPRRRRYAAGVDAAAE